VSSQQISGGAGQFQVSGALSFETVTAVLAESKGKIFSNPVAQIELDLGGVSRADSAGLALLLELMRMARAANVQITFAHLPQQLTAIAMAGDLDMLLPIA